MDKGKTTVDDVVSDFMEFIETYSRFRKDNNLNDRKETTAFEICTAILDKSGRIARQVKHFERKDPKEDWPNGMTSAVSGNLVYMMMLLRKYGITQIQFKNGMKDELNVALNQWSGKKKGK